jgi:MAF protein
MRIEQIRQPARVPAVLILASASPRRRALVRELGLPTEIRPADVPEKPAPGERPVATARRLALAKAAAAAAAGEIGVVLGGDTIVVHRGRILGKPDDPAEAVATLRSLRGRPHRVVTGVALIDQESGRSVVRSVSTRVVMRDYSDDEIAAYVASGAPLDKAGAYGIQDDPFSPVREIAGCYLNVVGLPLCAVVLGLRALGYSLPPSPWSDGVCRCAEEAPDSLRMKVHPAADARRGSR